MELLKKIDIIRARANVGYKEAKEALDAAGGDLINALIQLEERDKSWAGRLHDKGEEVLHLLREACEKGVRKRIRLKRGDRVVFELPAGVGLLGVAGMLLSGELAALGALGTLTAMLSGFTLEIGDSGGDAVQEPEGQQEPQPEG
ncbi:MAG: DUF4342 domain-containing protein [Thermacetogeniaceae bacterium]